MRSRRGQAWSVPAWREGGGEGRGSCGLPARRDVTLPRLATERSTGVFVPVVAPLTAAMRWRL